MADPLLFYAVQLRYMSCLMIINLQYQGIQTQESDVNYFEFSPVSVFLIVVNKK